MKIERETIPVMTLEEFAVKHGLTMEVRERPSLSDDPDRYYAHFKRCDVKDGGCLVGTFGNGATEEEAIRNYAKRIALKFLVFDAFSDDRREIFAPRLS